MPDIYGGAHPNNMQGPYIGAFVISGSAQALEQPTRGVYLATAGSVIGVLPKFVATGTATAPATVTFLNVPAGSILPVRFSHIISAPANSIGLF